ncbi:hypothetical protein [Glutamicibacter arilaitensis]|uniref:hypothetical protein n=1 Tax=Glutamicibacter arilaitensis TaxID=256701 RepID=UPI003FD351BE
MKKIGALGALFAIGMLAACSGSDGEIAEPPATATATPEVILQNGEALQQLANVSETCEENDEMNSAVFKYYADCGDNVLIEFGPAVDIEEHTELVMEAYRDSNDLQPWLISDEWMIKGTEKELLDIQASYPAAKYISQKEEGLFTDDVASAAITAVEKVYGTTCEEFYRNPLFFGYEVKAQKQFDCDTDPIEVFSSIAGVKGTHIYVFETAGDVIGFGEAASTDHEFDGKDRYGVEGKTVMIAPLPKAEAEEISKLVAGSKVVDLSLNPMTER